MPSHFTFSYSKLSSAFYFFFFLFFFISSSASSLPCVFTVHHHRQLLFVVQSSSPQAHHFFFFGRVATETGSRRQHHGNSDRGDRRLIGKPWIPTATGWFLVVILKQVTSLKPLGFNFIFLILDFMFLIDFVKLASNYLVFVKLKLYCC